ncbi:MAG: CPBP family intramembrane metalloprotease [Phycisphaerae bacterium]|nr:CPBP family intramembrane metalloprotease [Phycisphaerae bacterium]
MQRFFDLFGQFGMWAPALAIVVILLSTHAASREPWTVHLNQVSLMYAEAMFLAVPLLVLNWAIPLSSLGTAPAIADQGPTVIETIALGIGAGVYEELIFRLFLISIIMMIGVDLLNSPTSMVAVIAVGISALVFAAHHHPPLGEEPFELGRFVFRTMAGVYLALVFWFRGYGPAAGCHAAYNVALALSA